MKRSTRLVAVAVGVLGLVATTAPQPAQAVTVGTAVYVAQFTVDGTTGLGYPILTLTTTTHALPNGTPLQTVAHALGGTHPSSNCLQLPNDFGEDPLCLTNSHWTFQHVRTLAISATACLDLLVNIAKSGKALWHPPGCIFGTTATGPLPNTVTGHCGLNSGQVVVLYVDGLGQEYIVDVHLKGIGTTIVISGHWRKVGSSQHGLFVSVGVAIPPVGLSESCINKTARNFQVVGVVNLFLPDPRLP